MMENNLSAQARKDNFLKESINSKKEKHIKSANIEKNDATKINKMRETYKVKNINELSADIIKEANKKKITEEIIQIIEKRPDMLKNLDICKLEIIDQYYKDKIIEYKKKIANS